MPLLLSSIRGHAVAVKSLQYVPNARIVVRYVVNYDPAELTIKGIESRCSGSADHSVRLWTLGGRYLATLGTFRPWSTILPDSPAHSYFKNYRIPPDVKRIASFTTLKVMRVLRANIQILDKRL